jgi:hypothetical protein
MAALVCALGATNAHAQTQSGFYHPLTLAAAEPAGGGGGAPAKPAEDKSGLSEEELAKIAQNPVAALISVPFQNNFNFGIGPNHDAMLYNLNIQPVIPVSLSEDWNLIARSIIPILSLSGPGVPSVSGLGDITEELFFSPAGGSKKFIWGVGPVFTFPTATDSRLGTSMYSAGPGIVALTMQGHWVVGAVLNNQWSYAGWGSQDVNALTLQYFINYNISHGWYVVTAPLLTANWKASNDDRWVLPAGGGIGKLQKFGKLPVNFQLAAYWNAITPKDGASWQLRFQATFMFPK